MDVFTGNSKFVWFDFVLNYLARILDKLMVLFGSTTVRHCYHVSQMNKCVCFVIHFHISALCLWS